MSTDVLVAILDVLRKHANLSVKVEFSTKSSLKTTTITLKEAHFPSWKIPGNPGETKKEKRKKNPSRIRRDAKRREAYLAKNSESGTASSSSVSASALVLESPPRPRKVATPERRLENRNSGNAKDLLDKRETFGQISPIPQIDGLEGEASDLTLEEDGSGCTKTDIFNLLKEMQKSMKNFGEKCGSNSLKSSDGVGENVGTNSVEDDDFEDVKLWALAQKKGN